MGIVVILIVVVGLIAGVHALLTDQMSIPWGLIIGGAFVAGMLSLFGGMFSRNHNKDRDTNGEIEGRIQHFANRRIHHLERLGSPENNGRWSAKQEKIWDEIRKLEAQEKEFEKTIEYGKVTDGSENYYSYKGK